MSNKMREEFEAWAPIKHSHYLHPFNRIDGRPTYIHAEVQQDWAVWQASRAAQVIHINLDDWPASIALEIKQAIEAAGLKVAP